MVVHIIYGSWLGTSFIVCSCYSYQRHLFAELSIGRQPQPPHHPRENIVDYHRNRDVSNDKEELNE